MPFNMDPDIRLARPDDLSMVIRAAKSAFADPFLKLDKSRMDAALICADSCVVGVDEQDMPVAYTTFMRMPWQAESSLYLYEMGVHADFRGKGFGRRMLAALPGFLERCANDPAPSHPTEATPAAASGDQDVEGVTFETATHLSLEKLCTLFSLDSPLDPELRYAISSCMDYGRTVIASKNGRIIGSIGLFTDMAGKSVRVGYTIPADMNPSLLKAAMEFAGHSAAKEARENHPLSDRYALWVTTHPDNTPMLSLLLGRSFKAMALKIAYPLLGDEGIRYVLRHPDIRLLDGEPDDPMNGSGGIWMDRNDLQAIRKLIENGYAGVALNQDKDAMLFEKAG